MLLYINHPAFRSRYGLFPETDFHDRKFATYATLASSCLDRSQRRVVGKGADSLSGNVPVVLITVA
jgi:hypothetical protein